MRKPLLQSHSPIRPKFLKWINTLTALTRRILTLYITFRQYFNAMTSGILHDIRYILQVGNPHEHSNAGWLWLCFSTGRLALMKRSHSDPDTLLHTTYSSFQQQIFVKPKKIQWREKTLLSTK